MYPWRRPYSPTRLSWNTILISISWTLSIFLERQQRTNFSLFSYMNRPTELLWAPPSVPLLANVSMCSTEETLEGEGKMPKYYKRFADDTLTIMPYKASANNLLPLDNDRSTVRTSCLIPLIFIVESFQKPLLLKFRATHFMRQETTCNIYYTKYCPTNSLISFIGKLITKGLNQNSKK